MIPRWLKAMIGIALLPLCAGATLALGQTVRASGHADRFWAAAVGGAACWVTVYVLLPRPMRVYVLGHELTHALAAWLCGRRVTRLRVRARSGSVGVSRPNSLIVLAPYFFPLYAALVAGLYALGNLAWDWRAHVAWFHLLLGAAYAFHVTFTAAALSTPQSDLAREGPFFSLVIIWLGNVLVLLAAVPALGGGVGVLTALSWAFVNTGRVLGWLAQLM